MTKKMQTNIRLYCHYYNELPYNWAQSPGGYLGQVLLGMCR